MTSAKSPARGRPPRAKAVLIAVVGLHLVAETALTPFLPQLFDRLYGIDDPGATGLYLWVCRIVGLAALPLWGLAARRWPLHRLVLAGLCGSAVLDLLLGMAPSYTAYTVISTAVVATNSALLLAYPAFIAEHRDEPGEGERARLAGVVSIVVVFHLSVVVSTLVGTGVLALPQPRIGISAFAVLDVALAVLAYRVLGRRESPDTDLDPAASAQKQGGTGPTATRRPRFLSPRFLSPRFLLLAQVALIGLAFDFAVNVARPFFTEFAGTFGSGSVGAAALFFLPSVAALAVLPAVRRCHDVLGDRLLPLALLAGAAGYAWQAYATGLPGLVGGRVLFGVGLGLGHVAVELRAFRATGTSGPAFTGVETARSAGLLAAPLVATAAVSHDLALPLLIAAAVQVAGTVLALRGMRGAPLTRPAQPPGPAAPRTPAAPDHLPTRTYSEEIPR
ncbi:MFS transporter [Streptomyces scopuliridis]|uniref:MFS transporter n=1 Tax=Streptomyces scopuliridis TaxID=452529 RepID=UPI0010576C76|nr:MFS transporter [Streptomyces scopuliridis]